MQHHALLYKAAAVSKETALPFVHLLGASEVEFVEIDSFGIDDVRALTAVAYRAPVVGNRLGVVVVVQTITVEAEQALLKLLEEPPKTTSFLFCVPKSVFLLATLLSRFSRIETSEVSVMPAVFTEFINSDIPARITLVSDRLTAKDSTWQQEMKQGLVTYLDSQKKLSAKQLGTLYYVAEHLLTRGASNKQLLEEMAFSLPLASVEENGTVVK